MIYLLSRHNPKKLKVTKEMVFGHGLLMRHSKLPARKLTSQRTSSTVRLTDALNALADSQEINSRMNKTGTRSVGKDVDTLLKVRVEGKRSVDNREVHQDSK